MSARVLLVGIGGLGPWVLERLVRSDAVGGVVAADVDGARAAAVAGGTRLGTTLERRPVAVEATALDLMDADAVARLLQEREIDLIVQAGSLLPVQRWWSIAALPDAGPRLQRAGLGPWLALQLLLPLSLARAIERCGWQGTLLNLSYPDAVNAVIARTTAVTPAGAGNVSLLAAAVRQAVAEQEGCRPDEVEVALSTHYAHVRWAMGGGERPRRHGVLRVLRDGADLTDRLDPFELLRRGGALIPWGEASHPLTAASVVRHVELLLGERAGAEHMPGPCGLVGGYPVRVGRDGVVVDPPPGTTVDALRVVQEETQQEDGIAAIAADGTVTFTDEAAEQMRSLFGAASAELHPDDVEEQARRLLAALDGFGTGGAATAPLRNSTNRK
ncbi:hypothetical protein [Conexibacter arvalis]|uniref:Saccharopine dehydrogenase NADP binding domain-containing protein n=1 Tax=Conexibacter arvalis TaxID=912552 RepID=A0A840I6V6_9ACTN|nr:hypothetical protein [Conexibacter arvalis]MBB4660587.1 hypothetical protein [Conexibacter arvalis]